MTQNSIVETKELGSLSQDGYSRLPKWCAWCIQEARARDIRGFTVILANVEDCQSHLHRELQLVKAWDARGTVKGPFSPRKTNVHYEVTIPQKVS